MITYDVRGHGKSVEMLSSKFEMDDLIGILETEGIQRIKLVGCSLGAIIALDFVLAYPEYVDQLVLVSPGLLGFQEKNSEFLALMGTYVQAIQSGEEQKMVQELKKLNAIGETQRTLKAKIDEYVEGRLTDFVARKAHLRVPQIKEASPLDQLKNINTPTLVLSGNKDFSYIKDNAQVLAGGISNARLEEVANAGHLINLEEPKVFNKLLRDFFE